MNWLRNCVLLSQAETLTALEDLLTTSLIFVTPPARAAEQEHTMNSNAVIVFRVTISTSDKLKFVLEIRAPEVLGTGEPLRRIVVPGSHFLKLDDDFAVLI